MRCKRMGMEKIRLEELLHYEDACLLYTSYALYEKELHCNFGCDNHRIVSLLNKSILFNFYELSYIDIGDKRAGIFI